jgi:hypothetical protein
MIKMLNLSGRAAPVVICDICGKRVEEADLGAAVFPRMQSESEGTVVQVLHVHKGPCHDKAQLQLGGVRDTAWQELRIHFSYLLHNLGLSVEKLRKLEQEEEVLGNLR